VSLIKIRLNRIHKIFSITCISIVFLSTIVQAKVYPSPTDEFYVNDYANVLDDETESYINSMGEALEKATQAQVVVVTVNEIKDQALEEYSLGLLREWGIGNAKKNNGVLILLDLGGRNSRIEVGYGLEGALPDGKTGRIQDQFMIPYFKEDNYSKGITEGYNAIINEVYLEYGNDSPIEGDYSTSSNEKANPIVIFFGAILVIGLIILDFRFTGGMVTFMILRGIGRGGGGGSGRSGGGGSGGGGGSSRGF